jgi:hypothetical protein
LLWSKLNARVVFKRDLVARMEAQHQEIAHQLRRSNEALARWSKTGTAADATPLLESLRRLTDLLEQHLCEEEQQILPIAAEHLTGADCGELAGHGMAEVPPDWLPVTLGLCLRNLPPVARPMFLSHLPDGDAALWSSQWKASS